MRTKIVKVADKDILIQEKTIGEIKKMIQGALLPPVSGEVGPVQSASCAPAPRTRLQEPGAPRDDRIAQAVPLAEQ